MHYLFVYSFICVLHIWFSFYNNEEKYYYLKQKQIFKDATHYNTDLVNVHHMYWL